MEWDCTEAQQFQRKTSRYMFLLLEEESLLKQECVLCSLGSLRDPQGFGGLRSLEARVLEIETKIFKCSLINEFENTNDECTAH